MSKNIAFARAFNILVHFFAVLCKTSASNDLKIISFAENVNTTVNFFVFYLNLIAVTMNSAPGQCSPD